MRQLHYCGGCGSSELSFDGQKEHRCQQCGWVFFGNPAAAAAGLLWHNGELLMVRRGRDPAKGLLDLPGGFVDPDESAEEALQRELMEELKLPLDTFSYVGSYPNRYLFGSIDYSIVDLVFEAELNSRPTWHDSDELAGIEWCKPSELDDSDIAFASVKRCLAALRARRQD
ncbi:MAG: NUDIX hydrolase [Granulosicoccaceae bacterium]